MGKNDSYFRQLRFVRSSILPASNQTQRWNSAVRPHLFEWIIACISINRLIERERERERERWQLCVAYRLKGSYDAFLKIIILCIWCNKICWHALMFKKHIIFQILYIIVVPLCPASIKRVVCDWPNTTSTRRKCNAPYHNRELQLSS